MKVRITPLMYRIKKKISTKPNQASQKLKKLILHIGVHKTGTTAIQNFLYQNKDALIKQGIYLPTFLFDFENKPAVLRYAIEANDIESFDQMMRKVTRRAIYEECDTVLISDEDYCKYNNRNLNDVSRYSDYFEEVDVVIYCRRQDFQSESGYGFCVMWKGTKISMTPETWNQKDLGINYLELADFYRDRITNSKIVFESYDLCKDNLIETFKDTIGLSDVEYDYPSIVKSNVTPNKFIIEVMAELNKYKLDNRTFEKIKKELLNDVRLRSGGKPIFLRHSDRLKKIEFHRNSNLEVERMAGKKIFSEEIAIKVPPRVDSNQKLLIVNELLDKYGLIRTKKTQSELASLNLHSITERFRRELKINENVSNAEIYREVAVVAEKLGNLEHALYYMDLASQLLPSGDFIEKKKNEYRGLVNIQRGEDNE